MAFAITIQNAKKRSRTSARSGFTIVELLIVVVIIAILAAVVVVAYNGITTNAQKSSIASELKQWEKLFMLYKAQYGNYPSPAANPLADGGPGGNVLNFYCLGTGFPVSGGTQYCYAYSNPPYQVEESRGATLITELSKVGTPPRDSVKYAYGSVIGPYVRWYSDSDYRLYSVFKPGTDCSSVGLTTGTTTTSRQECYIRLY